MKKFDGNIAKVMKEIISDGETVIEIDGKKYHFSLIEEPETTVSEDIEYDLDLKQKLLQAKKDILDGKTYTSEKVIEMIQQGKL
ncbi:hypothetical protein DCC39_12600 [Pueribacillus theae]|uniref:Uncharacterized protein n=1 Tax=Pueribacillus theae TaxID=2171751 RepID=A0A2U1JXJ6_9BACI|nr:hypothetical protein [Pueribacillus theae]PWA09679.1 hypothetical protein DCC39_12600 [Pueribacillus theae]